jgi:hypothetical protein
MRTRTPPSTGVRVHVTTDLMPCAASGDQRTFSQRTPDFFRGVFHFTLNDYGAPGTFCHRSIRFNKVSRRSKRSRQKAPYKLSQSINGVSACGRAL